MDVSAGARQRTMGEICDHNDQLCERIAELGAEVEAMNDTADLYNEEINALKAENARLREGLKGDYDLDAWLEWCKEKAAKEAEIVRLRNAAQAVITAMPHKRRGYGSTLSFDAVVKLDRMERTLQESSDE